MLQQNPQTPMLQKIEQKPELIEPAPSGGSVHPSGGQTKNKTKIIITVIIVLLIIAGLAVGGFFVYKKYFQKTENEEELEGDENDLEIEEVADETANWQTYKTDNFEIKYPKEYEKYVKKINVKTKSQILKEYEDFKNKGGCPDACGKLSKDKNLQEKQFEILKKVNNEEELSEELENEIKNNFLLLSEANDVKYYINNAFSDNFDTAGLNLIGYDAYDPGDISKFYYRVAFLVNDKIAIIKLPLYSDEDVKNLMKSFGYNETNAKCDETCLKKMENYSKKVINQIKNQEFDETLEKNINNCDLIVSTFKFLK